LIGKFEVSNNAEIFKHWTISFGAPFEIVNIWDATILSRMGSRYTVTGAGWNESAEPNGKVSFVFEGRAPGNIVPQVSQIAFGTVAALPTPPAISISDAVVFEGQAGTKEMVFTISLSKAPAEAVTIPWFTQSGTALAGSDFTAGSGSVTFAPGETTKNISVLILSDTRVEADESFSLVLGTPTGATIADGTGLGTIRNDDIVPSLTIGNAQVTEGNAGTKQMVFTVTLSAASADPVTVAFATRDGTAFAGSDYNAATGTLSFAAGETSRTIAVTIRGDGVREADETLELVLSGANGATLANAIGRGTILDDDAPPVLTLSHAELVEGNSGTKQMVFTLSLSKAIAQSVTTRFATQDGTALAGSDYVAKTGTVTFAAGETSKTVSIAIRGDTAIEADESFNLLLSNVTRATLAPGGGLGTIRNDDLPPPTLSVSDAQVTEGNSGTKQMAFTVSLSRAATGAVSVGFTTQNGTALSGSDYTAATGTLSFAAGETRKTISVTVRGDSAIEKDETFSVLLRTPSGATILDNAGLGTILNDDLPPPSLTVSDALITEGDAGTKQMLFTVALSRAAGSAVSVTYATQAGTAAAGSDFTAASGTLNFAAGETSRTIAVTIQGDTEVEANETLNLLLGTATGATILDGTGVGTINNDDVAPTLVISDAQIAEGDAGTKQMLFTVALSRAVNAPVSVTYATQAGTALAASDFTAASGTLSFAAGETSKTIAVIVSGDTAVEADESFNLLLSNPSGATLLDGIGLGTIVNDDVAATASGDTVNFSIRESWNGGFVGTMIVVNDAIPLNGWTVEFDAPFTIGSIWNAQIVSRIGTHYVIQNAPYNGTLGPNGSTSFGFDASGPAAPTNLAMNGAAPLPGIAIADSNLTEGDAGSASMNFIISLSSAAAQAVTVNYATANGTALAGQDYLAALGSLTFAAGETSKTVSVAVLGDTLREAAENFFLHLSAPVGAILLDGMAVGSIRDNDAPAVSLPPEGYYSTRGNQIIDSTGEEVRLRGVNWFGMEGTLGTPDGLYARNWQDMMEQMVDVGFDTIRLPFSLQNAQPGWMPRDINYSLNSDLIGLSSLQILDKVVDYAGILGMKIILDCHRSSSGPGPNENGLWYDQNFSETQWIDTWKALATRYLGDSTVIGMDLQNEPHGASWTDWSAAAERAGNAIHEVNPNLLIIVEGVGNYQGDYYWWGGQLEGVRDDPVVLQQANKLVYSPHDYPNSIYPHTWFEGPDFKENLPSVFREHWGFIFEENIAPIFLGEFGTKLIDSRDIAWLDEITQYLNGDFNTDGVVDLAPGQKGMSFAYWSWNPNSTDTGGILQDDWTNVHQNKLAALESILIA